MSKTAKIVIFSVIGAFVLCCGGGVGGLFFVLNSAVKAPKAAAEDFLTKLEAGNNEGAYALLCRTTQNNYDREEFDALVQKDAPTKHDMSWGGSYSSENGLETASVTASLTHKGGWSGDHTFALRKEDGAWKVCGDPY
ncbi:Rv0361 family membrane protein [Dactylosporangium darangshiense]|uniref:DUF4878 domain-containing protein n=1 Tax=Dactylosporangium darangshiense TaxID=579108 RepID=A0ABP8DGC1_9ACTN